MRIHQEMSGPYNETVPLPDNSICFRQVTLSQSQLGESLLIYYIEYIVLISIYCIDINILY
jgi:hypothetical protein